MKRFVMAVALTGVISLTAQAGNVPTNDFAAPPSTPPAITAASPLVNTVVVKLVLTITTLIGR